ncbi:hypothetical protein CHARACLAT_003670 [Characodon lateralis]|uniref:Uncharacterized protein n=1 Tax=Characodon lateralis TaxID=208331 RepID=A0ABU7DDE7_9TELE|nr:hypothetical protein [Characodon lateralis]
MMLRTDIALFFPLCLPFSNSCLDDDDDGDLSPSGASLLKYQAGVGHHVPPVWVSSYLKSPYMLPFLCVSLVSPCLCLSASFLLKVQMSVFGLPFCYFLFLWVLLIIEYSSLLEGC